MMMEGKPWDSIGMTIAEEGVVDMIYTGASVERSDRGC